MFRVAQAHAIIRSVTFLTWFFDTDSPEFRGFKDLSLHGIIGIAP